MSNRTKPQKKIVLKDFSQLKTDERIGLFECVATLALCCTIWELIWFPTADMIAVFVNMTLGVVVGWIANGRESSAGCRDVEGSDTQTRAVTQTQHGIETTFSKHCQSLISE